MKFAVHACLHFPPAEARSLSDDLREGLVGKSLHRLRVDVAACGELNEKVQRFLFAVRGDDEHAIVPADGPILTFDFHSGFFGELVEVMRAFRGILDVLHAFCGVAEKCDIMVHGRVMMG